MVNLHERFWYGWWLVLALVAMNLTWTQAGELVEPTGRVPQAQGWNITRVVDGLQNPWSLAFLPDGSMLVTERPGRLRMIKDGQLVETPIAGVPPVHAAGQGGLLDVSLHPQFQTNRMLYLTYAHGAPQKVQTRVARAQFDGQRLLNLQVIFSALPLRGAGVHYGSRIIWMPDGTMLITVGDGGGTRQLAQRLNTHLGKTIRLHDDGRVPEDNPLVNRDDALPEIWSYGHRNQQGMVIDSASGRIWATEHGAQGGDEVNLIERGKNYGWPAVTLGKEYGGGQISPHRELPGMENAHVVWVPSIAPSGLMMYTGERFPQWKGDLFAGALAGRHVRRIDLAGEKVIAQDMLDIGKRVRDVRQGPDGLIYLLTDEGNGELLRIEPE